MESISGTPGKRYHFQGDYMMSNDLFQRFQQRLTAVEGEAHFVESIEQAADIIGAHPALADGKIVVPPHFDRRKPGVLQLLSNKGIMHLCGGVDATGRKVRVLHLAQLIAEYLPRREG